MAPPHLWTRNNSPIQPVLAVAGVAFDQARIRQVTYEFLDLKKRFFPRSQINVGSPPVSVTPPNFLDWVLPEIKGATLRRNIATGNRNQRRHSLLFLGSVLNLLSGHNARIMGRVLIKGIGTPIAGRAVYGSAIQTIFATFDNFLTTIDDRGIIVADSRGKDQNVNVAHSLFTQKFKASGECSSASSGDVTLAHQRQPRRHSNCGPSSLSALLFTHGRLRLLHRPCEQLRMCTPSSMPC